MTTTQDAMSGVREVILDVNKRFDDGEDYWNFGRIERAVAALVRDQIEAIPCTFAHPHYLSNGVKVDCPSIRCKELAYWREKATG